MVSYPPRRAKQLKRKTDEFGLVRQPLAIPLPVVVIASVSFEWVLGQTSAI